MEVHTVKESLTRGNELGSKMFLLIILLAVVLLFSRLGATTFFQIAEARNAVVPVEMMQRGDYVVPYFNGNLRTDKPPLHYYAMLLGYKLIGKHEAAARIFSALCGLIVITATAIFSRRHTNSWLPAFIMLASIHAIIQFKLATPDPYLIACHVLCLYCFYEFYTGQHRMYLWCMYVLAGLAFLAKGPVGIALPALSIGLFLLLTHQLKWSVFKLYKVLPGLIVTALIAMPWFILVHYKTNGAWTKGFFGEHNLGRFGKGIDHHEGPFILPLAFVLGGLFPFSVFAVRAAVKTFKERFTDHFKFFNLVAALVVIVVYSLSATKLINYTSPAYPFVACFTGAWLHQYSKEKKLIPEWIVITIVCVALPVVVYLFLQNDKLLKPLSAAAWVFLLLTISAVIAFYFALTDKPGKAVVTLCTGAIVTATCFHVVLFPFIGRYDSVRLQKHYVASDRDVIAYRAFNEALVFYHGKPIPIFRNLDSVKHFIRSHPKTLVLYKDKIPNLQDSIIVLKLVDDRQEMFSRNRSVLYSVTGN